MTITLVEITDESILQATFPAVVHAEKLLLQENS